ncbi:hypothetical protein YC2023_047443 [Brassica napus]
MHQKELSGVVFQLFEEVKKELDLVPRSSHVSLGRQKYSDEQINVEYNLSYVYQYHTMYACSDTHFWDMAFQSNASGTVKAASREF